jgi:hypothetical protein
MDTFGTRELRRLTANQEGPCVTIYLPTHSAGADGPQDALRLKNLVGEAERQLIDRGVRSTEAKRLLQPARELPADPTFWAKRSQGLALFVNSNVFDRFRVPLDVDEAVTVNRRFQVKPLLSMVNGNDQFFVLALSRHGGRLLEGGQFRVREIPVEGMPGDITQALNYDGADRGSQVHSAMRGDLGKQAAVFHGHGGERETVKEDLARYFRMVDAAVHRVLRQERSPLVLAGVQYQLAIYRDVASYAHIARGELTGSPDHLSDRELQQRAWPLVHSMLKKQRDQAAAKFQRLAGTGRASSDLVQIVQGAHAGQVETLFVDRSAHVWGKYDAESREITMCEERQADDDDLLDFTAVQTLLHGGAVFSIEPDMDIAPQIAAVFRY